jgi:hypothetical protein
VSEKTYSEAEYAQLASEVEALRARVAELSAMASEAEVEAKVSAATAELEQRVADLQARLDTTVAEAATANKQHDDLVAYLEAEDASKAEAAAFEARKAERIALVKEAAPFTDDYISENADRWAAQSEDEFAAAIEDWKTVAAKAAVASKGDDEKKDDEIPAETAMQASADNPGTGSAMKDLMALRFAGTDIRNL